MTDYTSDFIPIAELNWARRFAREALVSGDYPEARKQANVALVILATLPDGSIGGVSNLTWNRTAILAFLEQLDRLENSAATADSGGMVLQNYSYTGRRQR